MRPPLARSVKLERIRAQLDHLRFVRNSHLQWMGNTDNPETRIMHRDIAALMKQVAERYEDLLKSLETIK